MWPPTLGAISDELSEEEVGGRGGATEVNFVVGNEVLVLATGKLDDVGAGDVGADDDDGRLDVVPLDDDEDCDGELKETNGSFLSDSIRTWCRSDCLM